MCIYTHAYRYTHKRNRRRRRRGRHCRTRAGEVFLLTPRHACVCYGVQRAHKLCETRCRRVTSGFMEITPRPHFLWLRAYSPFHIIIYAVYERRTIYHITLVYSIHINIGPSMCTGIYMISRAYRPAPIIILLLYVYDVYFIRELSS